MSTRPQELKKIIDDLRQIIVGKVAMPPDQIEQITLFLFLKQLSKKHDELVRIGSKELVFTGPYERYHFDVLIRHSGEELVKECREAVESLYKNPNIDPTVRRVFERSYLKILDPKVLSSFLNYLTEKFKDGMDLGDFYEALLPILGTQNELGQFRTPRHIIDFIILVLDPAIGEKLCDPACGTGGFLVAGFNYLKEKYRDKKEHLNLNPQEVKKLYNDTIFGWDMEPLMVKFSLANLYLHGLKNPNVSENDTLLNENLWQYSFDIIAANPPFITPKGGARRHSRFAIQSNKTEVLFLEWMVHHLNYNGRMGVIVPEGIIFTSSRGHMEIRKHLLESGLWCIVSLPAQVFQPYSGVKTSIVFVDKTLTKAKNILYYEVENHGFSLNTNPTPIAANDLPEALKIITDYKKQLQQVMGSTLDESGYYTISKDKILESDIYNLTGGIYRIKKQLGSGKWLMVKLGEVLAGKPQYGSGASKTDFDGKNRYVRITDIKDDGSLKDENIVSPSKIENNCLLYEDDLLIARSGSVGRVYLHKKQSINCYFAGYLIRFPLNKNKILPKYLFFLTKAEEFSYFIQKFKKDVTLSNINAKEYSRFGFPLPPLEIQQQIVSELNSYQKIIDGARQVVENWKPNIKINAAWEKVALGELCEIKSGGTPTTSNNKYWERGKIPWLGSAVCKDNFVNEATEFITKEGLKNSSAKKFRPKTTLIALVGATIGKTAFLTFEATTNQNIAGLYPLDIENLMPEYLYYVAQSLYSEFLKLGSGKFKMANLGFIKSLKIPLPPLEIQKQIISQIESEKKIIEENKKLIQIFEQKIKDRIKAVWRET